jgi:hypothetical protein
MQQVRKVRAGTFHQVDTSTMSNDDGVSVGACCTGDCNQGRDCVNLPPREPWSIQDAVWFVSILLAGWSIILGLSWAVWFLIKEFA